MVQKGIHNMKYDFDSCIDRTKVMSIKWSSKLRQEMYGESDVIPLGIADMDFKAAPAVAKAIQDRAAHENYGYGYLADEFLMACVNWQKRRNHWDIKKEWITYTPLYLPLNCSQIREITLSSNLRFIILTMIMLIKQAVILYTMPL